MKDILESAVRLQGERRLSVLLNVTAKGLYPQFLPSLMLHSASFGQPTLFLEERV
jgi:hypothetical protein